MKNIQFTVEEENMICIYHNADRRRTITAISDALTHMDSDMQEHSKQTLEKLRNMTDASFEEAEFYMTLSDE